MRRRDESGGAGLAFNATAAQDTAVYTYEDAEGRPRFRVTRLPGKRFVQEHVTPEGNWVSGRNGTAARPYRLPELLEAIGRGERIFVCEGEKDVDALAAAGHAATCNPCGAGKWQPELSEHLAGADVVIVADKDKPGLDRAYDVRHKLEGKALSLTVAQAKEGKDAEDHLAAGYGVDDLEYERADDPDTYELGGTLADELVRVRRSLNEAFETEAELRREAAKETPDTGRRIVAVCAAEVTPEPTSWLQFPTIPLRAQTILVGVPGAGKSTSRISGLRTAQWANWKVTSSAIRSRLCLCRTRTTEHLLACLG